MAILDGIHPLAANIPLLLAYLADLELEVDRLRKQGQFVQHEVRTALKRIHLLCAAAAENGVGLPLGDPAPVFELFYRAAPVRSAGLGVGLAVVKLLVEQSGGTLTVHSGEGQGTCFVTVLPRYDVDDYLV